MRVLVIDVAAQVGGAVTILEEFLEEFKKNCENQYYVVLSTLEYENSENIIFINKAWVKKSLFHRMFFDEIYIKKIVKEISPDSIISLQNRTVGIRNIEQIVYYHNALPISEKRFSIRESRNLWFYQNMIGFAVRNSLRRAHQVIVQAEWIKKALSAKWKIKQDKIIVKRPICKMDDITPEMPNVSGRVLFYPANSAMYKNHENLLKACDAIWKENKIKFTLVLTGSKNSFSENCQAIIDRNKVNIRIVGRLNKSQMKGYYKSSILVFPSFIETIGLPLLEAKENGCQIMAADCEYAHETVGEYSKVLYFDPFNIDDIVDKIDRCLSREEG